MTPVWRNSGFGRKRGILGIAAAFGVYFRDTVAAGVIICCRL
jgi:hypothetical protein